MASLREWGLTAGATPAAEASLSVTEAVARANGAVSGLGSMVVLGEVSGFRGPNARSGHCYFTLKDEQSSMSVIVWRGIYQACGFTLKDGMSLLMTGSFDVYGASGKLSFKAASLRLQGEGLLRQRVAELARRLEREGLMDPARKRAIPPFCTRVAVVTSLSGSVIDDVKRTLARRNPLVEILASNCSVQGEQAPATIVRALRRAAAARPDVILLVRGGGSFEDLMCFNDETLARAVASCPVPVVTGIGHEPDTSICDMVADRRQSTPSTAAESVAPPLDELVSVIHERERRMRVTLERWSRDVGARLDATDRLMRKDVRASLDARAAAVSALAARRCLASPLASLEGREESLSMTEERLHATLPRVLARRRQDLEGRALRLRSLSGRLLGPFDAQVGRAASSLEALSPLKVLSRGYAIVRDARGRVVGGADQLLVGDEVSLRLGRGSATAVVRKLSQT